MSTPRPARQPAHPLLTRQQAADHLNVSLQWVKDRLAEGAFPHLKLGRAVRIRQADLDAFADGCLRTRTQSSVD
jgi:excisionase family DNA binding protein